MHIVGASRELAFVPGGLHLNRDWTGNVLTGNKGDIPRGHYYVHEGYGELSLPIISGMPFIRELEATAALRGFRYSNFGGDYTYKFGGRWSIIPDFTFRGTYSTGFRAPGILDLYQGQADAFPNVRDPCRGPGVAGGGPASSPCHNTPVPPPPSPAEPHH